MNDLSNLIILNDEDLPEIIRNLRITQKEITNDFLVIKPSMIREILVLRQLPSIHYNYLRDFIHELEGVLLDSQDAEAVLAADGDHVVLLRVYGEFRDFEAEEGKANWFHSC